MTAPATKRPRSPDDSRRCRPIAVTLPDGLIKALDKAAGGDGGRGTGARSRELRRILSKHFGLPQYSEGLSLGGRPASEAETEPDKAKNGKRGKA
jgi:hypothetical protein